LDEKYHEVKHVTKMDICLYPYRDRQVENTIVDANVQFIVPVNATKLIGQDTRNPVISTLPRRPSKFDAKRFSKMTHPKFYIDTSFSALFVLHFSIRSS